MSMHTYIGARYVPRFVGTYDATQSYEAMDVVDNGSGTSYIAKVPTPAGTPLTDTDHWFLYGSSSGAIVQLQNDMIQAQNDITQLQTDVAGLAMLAPNMIFIGDSWADGSQWTFPTWCECLVTYFGLDSDHYTILDDDSGGFADAGVYGVFEQRLSDYPVSNPDTVTHIIVAAGVNDRSHTVSDIKTAIASFVATARTMYPKARVYIACPAWSKSNMSDQQAIEAKSYVGYKYGTIETDAIWLEDPTYSLLFSSDFADGTHPNQSGSEKVAASIYNSIMCGADSTRDTKVITKSQGTSIFAPSNTKGVMVRKCHDTMNLLCKSGPLEFTCSSTNLTIAWKELCVLDDALNFGDYVQFTTQAIANGNTPFMAIIRIESATGQVYIMPLQTVSGVTSLIVDLSSTVPIRC